jgi:BlaI family transcriptional regulator, penicillinase repressor
MSQPRLTRLELKVMEALWKHGPGSVRELQEALPAKVRPAYTTVQTILTRLEAKDAVRRAKKISNAHIYEAVITRGSEQRRLVDDLLAFFGGRAAPLMSHLIESGQLTLKDVEEARKALKKGERDGD